MAKISDYKSLQTQQLINAIGWNVIEKEFNPSVLHHKETVFTIGNGYLGTRGTFEEGYPQECSATLVHGVYDDVAIASTELVNCPNWLHFVIKIAGEQFQLHSGQVLSYERRLDLHLGLLSRDITWRSPKGHTVKIHFERFASLANQHVLAIRCQIKSVDFVGEIEVEAGLIPEPDTEGTEHWKTLNQSSTGDTLWLHSQTLNSAIQLAIATKVKSQQSEKFPSFPLSPCSLLPGETLTVEKIVTLYTSRDTEKPLEMALSELEKMPTYPTLLAAHIAAWEKVWQDCDVIIEGDETAQLSVRYNIFQLLAVAPRHDDRVSIAPKTLSGFPYRGHVFWDTEIFILPLLTFTQPHLARNLLNYRYHTISGARRKAQEMGFAGAMYAWESAVSGDEVTPRWVPGPDGGTIRIWCGDIELHINSDIAYAVWQYWKATGDDSWMQDFGAEIILDTAIFWSSRVEWNPERNCYDIRDVIGPDENHDRVDNNAFTNIMTQWHLQKALIVWEWLCQVAPDKSELLGEQLNICPQRLQNWERIQQNLYINQHPITGLIEQCEGFFQLEDINLADYEDRTKSMQALLGIEAASKTQILKQPDVLMLLYLLRDKFDRKTLQTNWDYYHPRTDHAYGSSLGPAIHAILACDLQKPESAYNHFLQAALVDLENTRRNAHEGIHAASAGSIWQAVVFGFAGIRITENGPVANPNLPPHWQSLKFKLRWRNQLYEFNLAPQQEEKKSPVLHHELQISLSS